MNVQLPNSVRYVKNGAGGEWWKAAKENNQVHAGWKEVPGEMLVSGDLAAIESTVKAWWNGRRGATQDFNALRTLINQPSQHIWITFQNDCLWWCTVHDRIEFSPESSTKTHGHFWLTCATPWTNTSLGDQRTLSKSALPGDVTAVAGFKGTVCQPRAWEKIFRIINNQSDPHVDTYNSARLNYLAAIEKLVGLLNPYDFELLIDLILSRSGWSRVEKVGGQRADIDIEVENAAIDECAFVQVKGSASQKVLDDYVAKFKEQPDKYDRMIFACHKPESCLAAPEDQPIQVWTGEKIANLVVKHGLGDWLEGRI